MGMFALFLAFTHLTATSVVPPPNIPAPPPRITATPKLRTPPPLPPEAIIYLPPAPSPSPLSKQMVRILPNETQDRTCERDDSHLPVLRGGAGNERVWSGDGQSRLFGGLGRDFLAGGPLGDELHGGTDLDILIGGSGADRFALDSADDSPADENGSWSPLSGDTIVDLTIGDFDKVDLRALHRNGDDAPPAFRFTGRRPAEYGVWSRPRVGDTEVLIDLDGDARADLALRLLGSINLTPASFCGVVAST
jgi:hypothetical protein